MQRVTYSFINKYIMKILASSVEKLFTPYTLIALNLAIIILAEYAGGGTFFAQSGLVHLIALIFIALIIVRVFTDYAFSDYILKGFLRIQLTFFFFLGFVHIYEYLAEFKFMLREDVVQLTVMASYFVWLLSIFLALGFVLRIYYKTSPMIMWGLWGFFAICIIGLIAPSISPAVVAWFPLWFPKLILTGIITAGIAGIFSLRKLKEIMPVFREYSEYTTLATLFLILSAFSEYFEAAGLMEIIGISEVQNLYLSHFLFYFAISTMLIGFGKLKRPQGIYAEM